MSLTRDEVAEVLQTHCLGVRKGLPLPAVLEHLGVADTSTNRRALRNVVHSLRLRGMPICAHPLSGYYWAESTEELALTITFLRRRALGTLRQISQLQRVVRDGNGQLPLFFQEPDIDAAAPMPRTAGARVVVLDQALLQRLERLVMVRGDLTLEGAMAMAISDFLEGQNAE